MKAGSTENSWSRGALPLTLFSTVLISPYSRMAGTVRSVPLVFFSNVFLNVSSGNERQAGWSELPEILRLAITRRWSRPCPRRRSYSRPNASQHHSSCPPQTLMVVPGRREHLVPQTGRLLDGFLGHGSHNCSLRKFHQRRTYS